MNTKRYFREFFSTLWAIVSAGLIFVLLEKFWIGMGNESLFEAGFWVWTFSLLIGGVLWAASQDVFSYVFSYVKREGLNWFYQYSVTFGLFSDTWGAVAENPRGSLFPKFIVILFKLLMMGFLWLVVSVIGVFVLRGVFGV